MDLRRLSSRRGRRILIAPATAAALTALLVVAAPSSRAGASTASISAVGALADAAGTGVSSLGVSPSAVGDLLVVAVKVSSATVTVSSLGGGGASGWTRLESFQDNASRDVELWMGTVAATGRSSITAGFSGSVASSDVELVAQEFSSSLGSASVWGKDTAAGQNNASSTSMPGPVLTPAGSGELYFGYARTSGTAKAGTTPGFSFDPTTDGNVAFFDPSVSGQVAPSAQQSPANTSSSVAALITVSASTTPVGPPTVSAVSPSQGPAGGGTSVSVTGTNFTSSSSVHFGSAAASSVTVSSATSLTATAPPGSGTVDVTVTTANGTSTASTADRFTYTSASRASISAVGALADAAGTGVSSLGVSPSAVGDLLAVAVKVSSATVTVSSLGGGGASGWTRLESFQDNASRDVELWMGTVAATGRSSITAGFSGSVASSDVELVAQEFSSSLGSASVWGKDTAAGQNNASSTSMPGPVLTPAGSGELYFGYARTSGAAKAGTTPGFSFDPTTDGNVAFFDPSVSGQVAPSAQQSPANTSSSVAALITVSASNAAPPSIAAVGSLFDTVYTSGGTSLSTSPQSAGNVLVLTVDSHANFPVSTISGGGVAQWTRAVQFVSARGHDIELWFGKVSSAGSAQVTVTWPSPGISGYWTEYTAQEFSSTFAATAAWSVDNGQAASVNGPNSTTIPYPTLTPTVTGDLYYGLAGIPNNPQVGSTPGFVYAIDNGYNPICYDLNVSSSVSPTATQSPAGLSENVGVLLKATQGS